MANKKSYDMTTILQSKDLIYSKKWTKQTDFILGKNNKSEK